MLPFSSLAILPLLVSAPEWPLNPFQTAELGGTIVARATGQSFPSPVPVTVNLHSGSGLVASVQADLFGRYSLASPPGDYWLQIQIGGQEQAIERMFLRPGSWLQNFELGAGHSAAVRWPAVAAELCGHVLGRNGTKVPATVLIYGDESCVSGTRTDAEGRYCASVSPGTYWLRAMAGGLDVAYQRLFAPPASMHHNVNSALEVIELPAFRVTARAAPAPMSGS